MKLATDYAGSGHTTPPLPISKTCNQCGCGYHEYAGHDHHCRRRVRVTSVAALIAKALPSHGFDGTYQTVTTTFGRKENPLPGSTEGF